MEHLITISIIYVVVCIPTYEYAIFERRVSRRNDGFALNNLFGSDFGSIRIMETYGNCGKNFDRKISILISRIVCICIRFGCVESCSIKVMASCVEITRKYVYFIICYPSCIVTFSRNLSISSCYKCCFYIDTIATTSTIRIIASNSNKFAAFDTERVSINSYISAFTSFSSVFYIE